MLGSAAPGLGQDDDDGDDRADARGGELVVQDEEVGVAAFGGEQRAGVVDDGAHLACGQLGLVVEQAGFGTFDSATCRKDRPGPSPAGSECGRLRAGITIPRATRAAGHRLPETRPDRPFGCAADAQPADRNQRADRRLSLARLRTALAGKGSCVVDM